MIICIGREFGSGGHEIGKKLAEYTGIPFYDRELVDLAIEKSPSISEAIRKADEKRANAFIHSVWYEEIDKNLRGLSANDIIYKLQSETILALSQENNAIFVGRCSDYILKQANIPHLSLFITAPLQDRIQRKMELLHRDEKYITSLIRKTDKQRRAYYNYYTGGNWGSPDQYDFCINSSSWGIDKTAKVLSHLYTSLF